MRKRPPHVELWRDRHNKVRVYFRKDRGPRIALPNTIGSAEFIAAYQAALAGRSSNGTPTRATAAPGTIEALIRSYMASGEYRNLRATTKAGYASRLETLRREHGERTVSGLDRRIFREIVLKSAGVNSRD